MFTHLWSFGSEYIKEIYPKHKNSVMQRFRLEIFFGISSPAL